jgi:hypothetical protein
MVEAVPWPICLAVHRQWRYADAIGKRYIAMDRRTGARSHIREVRCEDRNKTEVPTS